MQTPIAFIVKQKELSRKKEFAALLTHGTHNGYVAVPEEHLLYGKVCEDPQIEAISIHGGITYADHAIYQDKSSDTGFSILSKYVGKINLLIKDGEFLYPADKEFLMNELKQGKNWWIFGFDTWHWGDDPIIWNKEAVISETQYLLRQLTEIVLK